MYGHLEYILYCLIVGVKDSGKDGEKVIVVCVCYYIVCAYTDVLCMCASVCMCAFVRACVHEFCSMFTSTLELKVLLTKCVKLLAHTRKILLEICHKYTHALQLHRYVVETFCYFVSG